MLKHFLALSTILFLAGCNSAATYKKAPVTGRFDGDPLMVPLGPNTFFFHRPDAGVERFSFTTHKRSEVVNSAGRGAYRLAEWKIVPEEMITTGASIPRSFIWLLPGLSPFDFTHAALIHDWLFAAHDRYMLAEKKGDLPTMEKYKEYAKMTQADAADIFAECIKVTMLEAGDMLHQIETAPPAQRKKYMATLGEMLRDIRQARPRAFQLNAYHYFVSPDCLVKTSVGIWNELRDDRDTYRLLTTGTARGYFSDWLVKKFKAAGRAEEARLVAVDQLDAKYGAGFAQAEPRVSFVLADESLRSQAGVLKVVSEAGFKPVGANVAAPGVLMPPTVEVRYFRPTDRAVAERFLTLMREKVRIADAKVRSVRGSEATRLPGDIEVWVPKTNAAL